jgi:hypothetical protein
MMLVGEMVGMSYPCLLVLPDTVRIVCGLEIGQHIPNVVRAIWPQSAGWTEDGASEEEDDGDPSSETNLRRRIRAEGVLAPGTDPGAAEDATFSRYEPGNGFGLDWEFRFRDSVSWDDRNLEFRFQVRNSGTFRRKIKSENLKTVQVENRNSGSDFSEIPEFR